MNQQPVTWRWGDETSKLDDVLERGGLLAIPTESTYGLAVDPRSAEGVATLYRFKNRPPDKALPVVLGDLDQLILVGGDPDSPELVELATLWPALPDLFEERPVPYSESKRDIIGPLSGQ